MNEMVSTDCEAVSVSAHLPNSQFRMRSLDAGRYRSASSVDRIETVGIEIVRHTAGTSDTGDDRYLMRRDTYLRHRFLQRHAYRMVTTSRAKTYVLI